VHVIARNSSFTYKGKSVDLKQVGRDLGVRYVLEGSVRKAGNRVRVTGQLIDAATGAHIWADRFDRDLTDIFAVQDELTQQIIAALKVKLTPEKKDRLARKGKVDVEAYNLFLRGRERMWLHTRSGNVDARTILGRAVTINPDFAAAHACIAVIHVNDYQRLGRNPRAVSPERFGNRSAGDSDGRRRSTRPRLVCGSSALASGARQGSCRGAALPRLSAKFGRSTYSNGPHSDMQR
jgi:hypothetical protein